MIHQKNKSQIKKILLKITYLKINYIHFIFIAFLFISLISCNKENQWDCFKKTGSITSELRNLENFTAIELNDNINLNIIQDTINYISIKTGKNLMENIKTEIKNNTLYIKNINKCNWVRKLNQNIEATLHCCHLNHLIYKGYGKVTSGNTLKTDSLYIEFKDGAETVDLTIESPVTWLVIHTGPGDMNIKGHSGCTYIYQNGYGFINAGELNSAFTFMRTNSMNNCHVNASEWLTAEITYIGNVYYYGNPKKIDVIENNKGHLIKAD